MEGNCNMSATRPGPSRSFTSQYSDAMIQPHPDDVIHLILTELVPGTGSNHIEHLNSSIAEMRTIGAIASTCHRFRCIAQPILYQTVRLNVQDRTDQLRMLLDHNPRLVASTKTLILGDATFAPPVMDLSGNLLSRGDNTRYDYLVSHDTADLLRHFTKLKSLSLSEMTIPLDTVRTCLGQLRDVKELKVDHCSFPSIAALRALYTGFPNLETLHLLSFEVAEDPTSHDIQQEQVAMNHTDPHHISHLQTLKLDPMWIPRVEDPTSRICDDIIRSGRADSLRVLDFNHSERQRLSSLGRLVRHTAQTLASLSLDCGIYGAQMPIPEFGPLSQLRFLRMRGVNALSTEEAAGLLTTLTQASHTLEVVLHLDTSSHLALLQGSVPLWAAIEAASNCSCITLEIKHVRWSSTPELKEQDVRDLLPKTIARETLFLSITTTTG